MVQAERQTGDDRIEFTLPQGFAIDVFAENVPGARVMVQDGQGNYWVSQPSKGTVSLLSIGPDGRVEDVQPVLRNLRNPHGLAIDPAQPLDLYVAEEDKISRYHLYTDAPPDVILDTLPTGGRHITRTIGFGPDGRLYLSIGSSCDVCIEKDPRRAAILSLNKDGTDVRTEATGLRNAVFFTWSVVDGRMWATDMGRDYLGDTLPPDEVNVIDRGAEYGWPYCYGKQQQDTIFDTDGAKIKFCQDVTHPSQIDLPAHVAPLGLAFIPEEGWPEDDWYDLLVAEHGSWNSTVPVGYKVVRIPLDARGNQTGPIEDFITGWRGSGGVIGRPVDLMIFPGGLLYVTDDKAGVIWRVRRVGGN